MASKKLFRSVGALLLTFGVMATAQSASAKDIVIALEGAYSPWNLTNPDGSLGGFEPALAKVLCQRAHVTCKLITADWDSMIPSRIAGKFDVVMDAMSITPERKKAIDFTHPYAVTKSTFVTAAATASEFKTMGTGEVTINEPGDAESTIAKLKAALKGKVIGIQAATNYVPFIRGNFSDVADIREYKSPKDRDLDLKSGRIDISIENTVYLHNNIGSDLSLVGPVISGQIWGDGVGLGIRKSDTALLDFFNKAIESVKTDGTLAALSKQYLKTDVTPK